MKKSFIFYTNPWDRNDATGRYMDIIARAFRVAGYEDKGLTNSLRDITNSDTIITINCAFGIKACLFRRRNTLVHWFQGIEAEERQFLHGGVKGRLQYLLWSTLERVILHVAKLCIFVSAEMVEHYKHKHGKQPSSFIMPCYNAAFEQTLHSSGQKFQAVNLVYAGSMHPWQRVKDVIAIYREIRILSPDARLTLLTRENDTAQRLCAEQNMLDVDIRSVPAERIAAELSQFSCGFILRDEMHINRVSTPTKLSSYLAAGVMPVVTTATPALGRIVEGTDYKLVLDPNINSKEAARKILELHKFATDSKAVLQDYQTIFETHYNDREYEKKMTVIAAAI